VSAPKVDELLTVQEAAHLLKRSSALLRRYCADGRLQAQLMGKTYVIRRSDLEVFRLRLRAPGRPGRNRPASR
jgi:excisionase family DNA binding protein